MVALTRVCETVWLGDHVFVGHAPEHRHAQHDLPPQRERLKNEMELRGVVVR